MIDYIKSILPRIQQYSKQLNDEANFVDIPWGFLDDDNEKVTYIFRRSGELLVSKRGEVVTGRWEYLPMMQSMLIEHEGRKRMYNQGFLDKGVMILRKDGTEELFPLANIKLIPDLDLIQYLETHTRQIHGERNQNDARKQIVILKESQQPVILESKSPVSTYYDCLASYQNSGEVLADGIFMLSNGVKLKIRDGKVINVIEPGVETFSAILIFFFIFIMSAIIYYAFTMGK